MWRNVAILIAFRRQGFQHPNLQAGVNNDGSLSNKMDDSQPEIEAKLQSLLSETNDTLPP